MSPATDGATGCDVLVVAGAGVDTIVRVDALPVPMADSYGVPPIEAYVGHTGLGVALGCHRLGLRTRFVDVIGDDHEGRLIMQRAAAEGLSFGHETHPSGTRRAVNLVDAHGRRLSFYDGRHPYDFVPDPDLWRASLGSARHVHASIMAWTIHALTDATAAGISTSTDLHDWDGMADHHRPFAYAADLVFLSGSRLGRPGSRTEEDVVTDIFTNGRARVVVVMDGARGSRLTERGGSMVEVPAVQLPGRAVVDSNGAGDSYVAAFLHAWLGGSDAQTAALAGSVGGAWACGSAGTHTSFVEAGELAAQLARLTSLDRA
ncbi:carbohydrate kinase family protein [Intrasporangium sp.]|uniref:carbohydrate kinase family protein n=1 Tax=Intrasporangium sp. TaxID=1925024 RepID=UPI002939AEEF|nr:carbohydrate kinase family protein [Intrasporangium sp.]MDV3219913.1 carbohydrate kinase family protein [Intrasporangium sp.]